VDGQFNHAFVAATSPRRLPEYKRALVFYLRCPFAYPSVAWAQAMGHREAAKLLQQTLDEEKEADKKLSGSCGGRD
jgi:hypothetical protein